MIREEGWTGNFKCTKKKKKCSYSAGEKKKII